MTLKTLKIQFYHLYLTRDVSPDSFCFKRTFSVSSHRGNTVRFSRRGQRGLDENPKSFSALIEKAISRFNGMISRNGGRPLIGVLVKDLGWVGGRLSRSRCALIVTFVRMCHRLHKFEGMKGLVLYLKTSYVLIQQACSGYIVDDLGPLKRRVRRDRSGFPLWIPTYQRHLMRDKDIRTIRFWTSLVSIYRVLSFPSSVSVSSITDPGVDWVKNVGVSGPWRDGLEESIQLFYHRFRDTMVDKNLRPLSFFSILRSSPLTSFLWDPDLKLDSPPKRVPKTDREVMSVKSRLGPVAAISTHPKAIHQSAFTIMSNDVIRDDFMVYAAEKEGFFDFFSNLARCARTADPTPAYVATPYTGSKREHPLGKLGLKDEPAGKVRVFAMVDPWTQWLLFPLHKLIQKVLLLIEEDATFDQVGKMEKKLDYIAKKYAKGKAFSFDLSSATDRLPIGLQVSILTPLLGKYPAKSWASILIDRDYVLPKRAALDTGLKSVRYAVGQPMGAYSSWVLLALTHHIIVQWSAFVVGKIGWQRWFKDYIVLGDDIVIFDPLVAQCYHHIMTSILGVSIGLAKSIKSYNGLNLEFAKKFWIGGKRCFVVPIRDCIVSCLSSDTMMEFLQKHEMSLNDYLRMRGLGYKSRSKYRAILWNLPNRLRVYLVIWAYYTMPFMKWVTMETLGHNFEISRKGILEFAYEICDIRKELLIRLEKSNSPTMRDFEKLTKWPFYSKTGVLEEMVQVGEFNSLIGHPRLVPELSLYTDESIRTFIWEVLEDIEKIEKAHEELPTGSWLRWTREEDRPFRTTSDIYLLWCRLNNCFKRNPCTSDQDNVSPLINASDAPAWGEIIVETHIPTSQVSLLREWYVWDFGYKWILKFLLGVLGGLLLLGWVPNGEFEDDLGWVSIDTLSDDKSLCNGSLQPGSHGLGWIGILLFSFLLGGLSVLLLGIFIPWEEFDSFSQLFESINSYQYEGPVMRETRSSFRFPTYVELIEWRDYYESVYSTPVDTSPVITRSPELGHGWSEPWSFNSSWPEQWR